MMNGPGLFRRDLHPGCVGPSCQQQKLIRCREGLRGKGSKPACRHLLTSLHNFVEHSSEGCSMIIAECACMLCSTVMLLLLPPPVVVQWLVCCKGHGWYDGHTC